ncbi:MAG: ABC transporter substrate-binding protein, partial [Betaproteobacteria bacterium]|nr:ABC transporter substrate-binding protein [Betaproteobacteria bacterium]
MSYLRDPYRHDHSLGCSCGRHRNQQEHNFRASVVDERVRTDPERLSARVVETALLKALFPRDETRRRFLRAVGSTTAAAVIAEFLPLGALTAMAQDKKSLEKKELKVGFIPITCATPLIMADPLNFYKNEGLDVALVKTAGWALIRDKMLNKEYDAAHMLAPMPIAISMGIGSVAEPMNVA